MTLLCISDGFVAIELSTCLIGRIVFSFALQVWTLWWKTWIISFWNVATYFRVGHFSKSSIAAHIMQVPALSKFTIFGSRNFLKKEQFISEQEKPFRQSPIRFSIRSSLLVFTIRSSTLNLLSTFNLFFPYYLITFRSTYIEWNLINSFHWLYIPHAP